MKTEHTPEPWFWNEKYGEVCFRSKEDDQSYGMACPVDLTAEANARRIVACVNACSGIPTEALEDGSARAERDALREMTGGTFYEIKKQRDELLAAAEAIEINAEECLDFDECTAMLVQIDDYHKLMEAIASVKEMK